MYGRESFEHSPRVQFRSEPKQNTDFYLASFHILAHADARNFFGLTNFRKTPGAGPTVSPQISLASVFGLLTFNFELSTLLYFLPLAHSMNSRTTVKPFNVWRLRTLHQETGGYPLFHPNVSHSLATSYLLRHNW
jgi:hypothetical protein